MPTRLHKYTKTFAMGLLSSMEYRMNFILSLLSSVFPIMIQIFLWRAIFQSSGQGDVYGYSEGQAIAYSILAALFSKLASTGFEYEVATDVKTGQLSKFVVQPIRYFAFRLCRFLGEKCLHLGIILVVAAAVVVALHGSIPWDAGNIAICLIALCLSVSINFLIYYNLSMISFWMLEVWGIFLTFSLIANIAGGGVFPLDMFGDAAQTVLNLLPFKYIIFFPVSVLLGKSSQNDMITGLGVQVLWMIILFLFSSLLWRKGLKKYESAGG